MRVRRTLASTAQSSARVIALATVVLASATCRRDEASEPTLPEIQRDASAMRGVAQMMVRPRVTPSALPAWSKPTPLTRHERDEAIEALLRGRAAIAAKAWTKAIPDLQTVVRIAPFDPSALRDLALAGARAPRRESGSRVGCTFRASFGGPRNQSREHAEYGDCALEEKDLAWAAHHFDRSLALRFDPAVKRRRDALGPRSDPGSPEKPIACTVPHPTIEALCQCIVASTRGEPCEPVSIPCSFVSEQTPNGDLFVLRTGRDDGMGVSGGHFLAQWHDGAARAVARLGSEDFGIWQRAPRSIEIRSFTPSGDSPGAPIWIVRVEERTLAQGLVEQTEEIVERAFFCHRPTADREARCPVDLVVRTRTETRAKLDGDEPLSDELQRRVDRAIRVEPAREARVAFRVEAGHVVTTLETGSLEDLPSGAIGSFPID